MSLFNRMSTPSNMQEALQKLQSDPGSAIREAGVKIPDNLMGNPQAMVQHLIQTGQVGGAALQRVMPMIQRLMGK